MPRRKGPAASRSLFSSLPHELRQTIRLQGVIPAPTAPVGSTSQAQTGPAAVHNSGISEAGDGANRAPHAQHVQVELVRTQPESESEDDSSSGEEEEMIEQKGRIPLAPDSSAGVEAGSPVVADSNTTSVAPAHPGIAHPNNAGGGTTVLRVPSSNSAPSARKMSASIDASEQSAPTTVVKTARTEGAWIPAEDYDALVTAPRKKRRRNVGGNATVQVVPNMYEGHPYDCTGSVERYSDYKEVPADIRKYFAQRHAMFAEYDELPLLLDHTGWFSVTPQAIARHIAERCRCDVIVDAFCGIGGNAIEFAKTCERVIAIDNDLTRLKLARHNALQYGVADRIEFIHGSFIDFARAYAASDAPDKEAIDVVFLSPPWGGVDYLTFTADPLPFPPSPIAVKSTPVGTPATTINGKPTSSPNTSANPPKYPLSAIEPIHGADLFRLSAALTPNIAYYLPKNTNLQELADLAAPLDRSQIRADGIKGKVRDREWVEVEEELVGEKVKAVTAYYGALVSEAGMSG